MIPAGRSYASGAVAVVVSTALTAVGGFVSLYLLARILTKDDLGGYSFAFNVLTLLAFVATWGFDRTIMLRVARLAAAPSDLRGRGLVRRATVRTVAISCVLAALLPLAASRLIQMGALPAAGFWLPAMAVALIPMAVSAIFQAWFRANSRVEVSSLTYGAVNAVRALLLVVVLIAGGGPVAVAVAVILSACVPVVTLGWLARGSRDRPPAYLRPQDMWNGAFVVLQKLSHYGLNILDVILVGLLASGAETAEYAVAARLAAFCGMGAEALQPTFSPRSRRHFARGDTAAAGHEYHLARAASFLVSLAIAIPLVLLGPPLLGIFGDFAAAYPPMLILTAGYVAAAGAGLHFTYLQMQGELLGTTFLRLSALGLLVAASVLLVPGLGAKGGALALFAAVLLMNGASVAYLYRRTGFAGVTGLSLLLTGLAVGLLLAGGIRGIAPPVLALALVVVGVLAVAIDRHARQVLRLLADEVLRRS